MKKNISPIFFFTLLLNLFFINEIVIAQLCDTMPYQHIYYNKDYNLTRVKNLVFTKSIDIYICGYVNQSSKDSNVDAWLMRTTYHGTPLWSKAIGTPANETVSIIRNTKNGDYIMGGATRFNAPYYVCWVARTDSLGNPLWSFELKPTSGNISQIDELDNGDFIAIGNLYLDFNGDGKGNIVNILKSSNFIIRFDKNGKILWQRSFYHNNKEKLSRIQEMPDGNFIANGIVLDSAIGYILKIDQHNGNIIWMNQYESSQDLNYNRVTQNTDQSLIFQTENKVYYLTADGKFKPGAYKTELVSNNKTFTKSQVRDVGPVNGNEIYFANIQPDPVLFSFDNTTNKVQWARSYLFGSSEDVSLGGSRIFNKNIYISGSYKASKISDSTSNEQMAYLLKATTDGKALCFDTADISLSTVSIPTNINTNYVWKDEGAVSAEFIDIYSNNLEPVRAYDCTQQTCCNDVAITHKTQICDNIAFKLPDGNLATKPGFYTTRANTFTGCDSIIYTILSPEKKIDLSLISDTCLADNKPITFTLPVDSTIQYRWQDGSSNNNYTANFPGSYWVTAVSSCNAVIDSVKVHDNCNPDVFIPSAFTPNNDGLNDVFRIPEFNGQHLENFNIYNRYGQLIFHSDIPTKGWDGSINGTPQQSGTYVYFIQYFDILNKPHFLKGTVVLIR